MEGAQYPDFDWDELKREWLIGMKKVIEPPERPPFPFIPPMGAGGVPVPIP